MACEGGSGICVRIFVLLGTLAAVASIVLGVTSFVQEQWVYYNVTSNTSLQMSSLVYNSRFRGIFYECLEDRQSLFLQSQSRAIIKFGVCVELDYGQINNTQDATFLSIIRLRQAQIGLHATGFAVVTVALLLGILSVLKWCNDFGGGSSFYKPVRILLGIFYMIGGFAYIISLIIFHILMDKEMVTSTPYLPFLLSTFVAAVSPGIPSMTIQYNVMYGLAWGATGLAFIASFCLFGSSMCCEYDHHSKKSQKEYLLSGFENQGYLGNMRTPIGTSNGDVTVAPATEFQLKVPPTLEDEHSQKSESQSSSPRRLPRYQIEHSEHPYYTFGDPKPVANKNVYRLY